ncbi:MAG: ferrous iron transport protein A [Bacteroidetes bacterium]|nr:ferrous iron transport protein A [Bacteroidota bacterium]
MLLTALQKGKTAIISKVNESEFKEKLLEMGCVPGTEIRILLKAPLGDPIAFDIDGYCLSMRKKEADSIEVDLIF